jgi:hypothetical protein
MRCQEIDQGIPADNGPFLTIAAALNFEQYIPIRVEMKEILLAYISKFVHSNTMLRLDIYKLCGQQCPHGLLTMEAIEDIHDDHIG